MSARFALGLDLGTSALKAVLLDAWGTVVGHAEAPLSIARPMPGWAEQHPMEWWIAACQVLDQLRELHPQAWPRVDCIGLAGQMHGAVVLNEANLPIRQAILHNDGRADQESQRLATVDPSLAPMAGSRPMAGFTAPKLLWLSEHEPATFGAVDCVLSPKDYLCLRLTGRRSTDVSDASGTLWFDVTQRRWSGQLAAASGMALEQLPPVLESSQPAGTLLPEVATRFALNPNTIVAAGAGDTPASGVGIGAVAIGDAFINLSTSASLVVVAPQPILDAAQSIHALCHAVPNRYYQMGAMLSGASCLRWITQATRVQDEAAMLRTIEERIPLAPSGLRRARQAPLFLPYLSGERTPHNNVDASGVFFGLTHETDAAQLGYAVIEGVCFGLRDAMHAIESTGTQIGPLAVVGGGARSRYWADLLASVLNKPIRLVEGSELSAAIGAARLGWLALGRSINEVCTPATVVSHHLPNAEMAQMQEPRYQQYRGLYQALVPLFAARMQGLQGAARLPSHADPSRHATTFAAPHGMP
jgi:xylulokinase